MMAHKKPTPKKKPVPTKRKPAPKVESKKKVLLSKKDCLRLNLGSGECIIDGFDNIDLAYGTNAYPLEYEDGTVHEIRASHILEHFPYEKVEEILKHWVSKLRPGGVLKIAVPDFRKIAKAYLEGTDHNVQGFILGRHQNAYDSHGSLFDVENLLEVMVASGLVRIDKWTSSVPDTASIDWSLNLVGYKPAHEDCGIQKANIQAVLGAPRFGPVSHMKCAFQAFQSLGIPYTMVQGCFWHQNICNAIKTVLAYPGTEYVLTCDYDSVFAASDVIELYRILQAYPKVDAVCALQGKRDLENVLISIQNDEGTPITKIPRSAFLRNTLEVSTGHFGLTLIRADLLRDFPKPWMNDIPNEDGEWEEGRVDADISFWKKWREEYGKNLYLAPKVVIGHHVEVVMWPDNQMKMVYQTTNSYHKEGPPKEVIR
jgi:hypothetical protein